MKLHLKMAEILANAILCYLQIALDKSNHQPDTDEYIPDGYLMPYERFEFGHFYIHDEVNQVDE